jgi:hypothetical protein
MTLWSHATPRGFRHAHQPSYTASTRTATLTHNPAHLPTCLLANVTYISLSRHSVALAILGAILAGAYKFFANVAAIKAAPQASVVTAGTVT